MLRVRRGTLKGSREGASDVETFSQRADRAFVLFMAVSFLGWLAETLFFWVCYGRFCDRGFLTLPFCTIYGCAFLLTDLLLGIPGARRGGLLRGTGQARHPAVLYALTASLLVTLLELSTGSLFQTLLGLRLWDYSAYRFHFHGYICLEYALLWAILLPPCMKYLFLPLKERVAALPVPRLHRLSVTLALAAAADWCVNLYRLTAPRL